MSQDLRATYAERWPFYDEDEIEAVVELLRSGRVNQWTGNTVATFERSCEKHFGGGKGIALANGSVALELALRAFGIGPGDEVIVSPRSFVASASCVRLVGATPIFADVDPNSGNITAETIEAVVTDRTKAVIPVHLAGWPCDMPAIVLLAAQHNFLVIEDCAQAHGAAIAGRPVGSFGDAAAFSFCQDKIISTGGEGGYVSFKDEEAWEFAWSFKDHGKNREKVGLPADGAHFRWLHDSVGTNWRLTAPQAALGIAQLEKLARWIEARSANAEIIAKAVGGVSGIETPKPSPAMKHSYYKYYFYLTDAALVSRDDILESARVEGIRLFSGSCSEIYRELAFDDLPMPSCPVAERLGRASLMMEVHPTLSPELLKLRAERVAEIADGKMRQQSS